MIDSSTFEITGDFPESDDDGEDEVHNNTLTRTGVYQYRVRDILVDFPYEAYESQLQMMEKIIDGVSNAENCLLESPTGTGKTAALLCALLAWQKRIRPMNRPACTCGFDRFPGAKVDVTFDQISKDFQVTREEVHGDSSQANSKRTPSKKQHILLAPAEVRMRNELCQSCLKKYSAPQGNGDPDRLPRIYYATRTHSQIQQVINQLKQTSYSRVNMTVLSGRKHSCTNIEVRDKSSRDDHCDLLVKNYFKKRAAAQDEAEREKIKCECKYYQDKPTRTKAFERFQLVERNMEAWDIEDAKKYGESCKSCPFYGMKTLHENADIVFCTYNYLLHPSIRKASNIQLENSILVFDEAHNIEEKCRDVSSISINEDRMRGYVLQEVNKLTNDIKVNPAAVTIGLDRLLEKTFVILTRLSTWIRTNALAIRIHARQEEVSQKLSPEIMSEDFKKLGLGPREIFAYRDQVKLFGDSDTYPTLEKTARQFIEKLTYVLSVIYREEMKNVGDYAYLLIRRKSNNSNQQNGNSSNNDSDRCELRLICLNPGLAFRKLRDNARSIIVASGTLSPTNSFESELETDFKQQLSARHVVGSSQVWAGILTRPVSGNLKDIALTVAKQEDTEIQDWLGEAILHYSKTVPYGVLVFMPSYKFLNTLRKRWKDHPANDPLIKRLESAKEVFYEESGSSFKMETYKEKIRSSPNGCLLFAIFRGNVSEGVDFKDDQARAVITVGIPNLPYQEPNIVAKMEYNTMKNDSPNSKHLSGNDWYYCQGYRALNQAFGRCIRHQNDWGALILLDTRLSWPSNKSKLSKWVQDFLKIYYNPAIFSQSLINFVKKKLDEQRRQKELDSGFGEGQSNEASM